MVNIGCIRMDILMIRMCCSKTNTNVCMYTQRTYSSRCNHIAAQVGSDLEWKLHWYLYNCLNRHEKCENCIDSHLTGKRSENYIQLRNYGIEI